MADTATRVPHHAPCAARSATVRRKRKFIGAAALIVAAGTASQASAQWTVVNLHPAGAQNSEARGVEDGHQVGSANFAPGTTGFDFGAVYWTGSAGSAVVLDPTPIEDAHGYCIQGGTQYGSAEVFDSNDGLYRTHAAMWSGSAGSFVDLHPLEIGATNSGIVAAADGVQGGLWNPSSGGGGGFEIGFGQPCIWHGTPESFVDLTPISGDSANVLGVFGNQQVGANYSSGFVSDACMWNGTPESYVNLAPAGSYASTAKGTDGVHQYGGVLFVDFSTFEFSFQAGSWSGTPDSWVDMTPAGAPGAAINAVDGSEQVGVTFGSPAGDPPYRAALWNGSAESYVDLQTFVPAGYSQSEALDIWHDVDGNAFIVGYAVNDATGENEAIMWLPARPGADLITSVTAPSNCTVAPGRDMNYTVSVANGGLDASSPATVTVTLPGSALATYSSASLAPSSVTATAVTFDLPAIAAGTSADITVTLTAVAANADVSLTAAATTTADYDTTNNSDAGTTSTLQPINPGDYLEMGDAPELAGGQVIPGGPLTVIEGELDADADMYQIRVDDWAAFSATVAQSQYINACRGVDRPLGHTSLMLFDANGFGIALNNGSSAAPSLIAGDPGLTGRTNGEAVWLAISQYDYLPTSGGEGLLIWVADPNDVARTPDGFNPFGAVDGWENAGGSSGKFTYRIELAGTSGISTCAADLDGSGAVDVFDLLAYLDLWFTADAGAELTGDAPASIDVFDLLAYLDTWFTGC